MKNSKRIDLTKSFNRRETTALGNLDSYQRMSNIISTLEKL